MKIDRGEALRSEKEIISSWKREADFFVSICCPTYNHAAFIEDAFHSFLSQKTDFRIQIDVFDDCSTDGTSDVIRKYIALYPSIFKHHLPPENQYSKGINTGVLALQKCLGSYIATCEGDDYWTDDQKLQLQVDFLEENMDVVLSFHMAKEVAFDGKKIKESLLNKKNYKNYTADELIKADSTIPTMAWLFRNQYNYSMIELLTVKNADTFLLSLLGNYGKAVFQPEILPGMYRVHVGGVWSMVSQEIKEGYRFNTYNQLQNYYFRIGKQEIAKIYQTKCNKLLIKRLSFKMLISEVIKRIDPIRYLKNKK